MCTAEDIDEFNGRKICCNCVEEEFLKDQISNKGKQKKCSYCGEKAKCFTIEEMTELIEAAFNQH